MEGAAKAESAQALKSFIPHSKKTQGIALFGLAAPLCPYNIVGTWQNAIIMQRQLLRIFLHDELYFGGKFLKTGVFRDPLLIELFVRSWEMLPK